MRVVAVSRDLMDRSKLTAALPDVHVVSSPSQLGDADVVLVDLSIVGALDAAVGSGARVVAYGSHVDEDLLDRARAQGAEALPRSVFFRRLKAGDLLD